MFFKRVASVISDGYRGLPIIGLAKILRDLTPISIGTERPIHYQCLSYSIVAIVSS